MMHTISRGTRPCPVGWAFAIFVMFAVSGVVHIEPAPFDLLCLGLLFLMIWRVRPVPIAGLLWPFSFLALFGLCNVVPGMFSTDMQIMTKFLATSLYMICILLLVMLIVADWSDGADIILRGYTFSAVVGSVLSVLSLYGYLPYDDVFVSAVSRAKGFFKDPNVFAPFLVLAVLYALYVLEKRAARAIEKLTLSAIIFLLAIGNVFAASRAGWLNLVIALVVYVGLRAWQMRYQPTKFRTFAAVLVCLGAIGTVSFAVLDVGRFNSFLSQRAQLQNYDEDRFAVQKLGLREVVNRPIGIGPGQYEVDLGWGPFARSGAAHSLYVRVLVENGLLGILSLLLFLVVSVARGLRLALDPWPRQGLAAVFVASLIGSLVNAIVVDTLHWRHLWIQLGLLWGLHALRCRAPALTLGATRHWTSHAHSSANSQ